MRAWFRARKARRDQEALDRLHGRTAKPPRHRRGGSRGGDWVDEDDIGDMIASGIGWIVGAVFKIFDD